MRGTDRQAEVIGGEDGEHGHQLGAGALCVGKVLFADLFANGDDDALPSDHGAHAQSQSHGNLYPGGNELGGLVDRGLVSLEAGVLRRREGRLLGFLHDANGFAGHVHVVAHVGLLIGGNSLQFLVKSDFVAGVFDQFAKRQNAYQAAAAWCGCIP